MDSHRVAKAGPVNPWIAYGAIAVTILFFFVLARTLPLRPLMAARRAAAMSCVKQLGLAALEYADDADGRLPEAEEWMDCTSAYAKSLPIYRAPGLSGDGVFGFAFRRKLSDKTIDTVVDQGKVALIFDSTDTRRNASGGLDLLPNPPRYGGKNVVCVVDGHGKAIPTPGITVR
jgi:hypothetical protein